MDHSFPIGSTRHHHNNAGNSQQYRISGAGFSSGGTRNSSNSNSNNHSQQQILNSVSSLFGSGVIPPNLFGRTGNSNNYINSTAAPNHFNFPLRSNTMNNRSGYGNGNNPNGNGSYNRNRSTHSNQPSGPNVNKNRNPGQSSIEENAMNQNQQQLKAQSSEISQPQYRIFKRGETIPGISSPVSVITGSGNGTSTPEKVNPSSILNGNCNPEVQGSTVDGNSIGTGAQNQNKENSKIGDVVDGNSTSKGQNQPNKTPVSLVSDIARFHGLTVEYRLVAEKGPPHSPTFTVALHLGPNEEYVGQGSSIKRAQHAAASEALETTGLSRPAPRTQPRPRPFGSGGKRPNWALIQLTSLVEDLKEPMSFIQQPVTIIDPFRRGDPPSVVSVRIGERMFTGEGSNFNGAKNMAAMIALKAMIKVKQDIELKKLAENGGINGCEDNNVSLENKSPISVVHEMAMKRGLTVKFEVTREEGPPHNKVFTVICAVGTEEHSAEGQGPTKQAAKKAASELMIEKMNEIPLPAPTMEIGSLKSIQRGLFRQKVARKKSSAPVVKDLEKQTVSPISRLIQIAHIKKYKEPEFNLVASSATGMTDELPILKTMSERDRRNIRKKKPSFTMEVVVGPHCSRGTGPNKKAAKKAAAESALIELGYGPSESSKETGASVSGANDKSLSGNKQGNSNNMKFSKSGETGKSSTNSGGTITSARQLVPGVIVLSNEKNEQGGSSPTTNSAVAQEMIKVNSLPSTTCGSAFRDGTEKLAYLARLLDVPVSYSDFPKKNEFLSVVSLGTNPPHVAHGCGASLDEAQNTAALKILEELSDIGLDSVKSNEEVSKSFDI